MRACEWVRAVARICLLSGWYEPVNAHKDRLMCSEWWEHVSECALSRAFVSWAAGMNLLTHIKTGWCVQNDDRMWVSARYRAHLSRQRLAWTCNHTITHKDRLICSEWWQHVSECALSRVFVSWAAGMNLLSHIKTGWCVQNDKSMWVSARCRAHLSPERLVWTC